MVGKYLLVAAYCGSYNPAKTDLRLFGRAVGPNGKKKKGGGTRRAGYGRVRMGKVSGADSLTWLSSPILHLTGPAGLLDIRKELDIVERRG